jgi:multiple sugar transport system permease protein
MNQSQPAPLKAVSLPSARGSSAQSRRDNLTFWLLTGPLVVGLAVFTFVPIVWGFAISLFDVRGQINIDPSRFVGLWNYQQTLNDPAFWRAMGTVALYGLMVVPLTICLGLSLALLVNSVKRGQAFYRSVYFMPTACSYVIAAMIWKSSLFSGLPFGIANSVARFFGQEEPIVWTYTNPWIWVVLISLRLWIQLGFNMLIFLTALQEIPAQLYEAARVDGASPSLMFRRITWPLLSNTTIFLLIVNVAWALNSFDEFYNVLSSSGGASFASSAVGGQPPIWYIQQVAFKVQDYGRGNAAAFLLTFSILFVTQIQNRIFGLGKSQFD